jgi:hypothetical protein
MGLLAGVAVGAYAQTDNVAALPPGAQAPKPPAAIVAPSADIGGPKAGEMWSTQEKQTQQVRPSAESLGGPKAGESWSAQEKQSGPVTPSPQYPGVRPN